MPSSLRGTALYTLRVILPVLALLVPLVLAARAAGADGAGVPVRNGFPLSAPTVPVGEIVAGGPPRDGIPALEAPKLLTVGQAPWHDQETVIGVELGGEARAYPLAILNWHELVNDTLGGRPILISYCPLCGTGLVFDRRVGEKIRIFGVSGLLYQSDMLMYDRETESLWSQIKSSAVTGPASGARLTVLRSDLTTWGSWKSRHPHATVLSLDTGHQRDYARTPYSGYSTSSALYFPAPLDRRYHPKTPTLGIRLRDGRSRAYPADELVEAGGEIVETFAGRSIIVTYDEDLRNFDAIVPSTFEVIEGYWFAWSAFHPSTTVFTVSSASGGTTQDE